MTRPIDDDFIIDAVASLIASGHGVQEICSTIGTSATAGVLALARRRALFLPRTAMPTGLDRFGERGYGGPTRPAEMRAREHEIITGGADRLDPHPVNGYRGVMTNAVKLPAWTYRYRAEPRLVAFSPRGPFPWLRGWYVVPDGFELADDTGPEHLFAVYAGPRIWHAVAALNDFGLEEDA